MQLERASKLISGLGGEKIAWKIKADKYKGDSLCVVGDSIVSSGIVSYMGAFPIQYREETTDSWLKLLK